ncbi:MAG TPA: TldD/PmbA family protein [candidate division WOR-3 bacterium]|uniref:TldD/PmbA family protein n=1 Tax=candidate division WOR-3 bacterium TaxID=2052148 RepID=A0A9C9EM48_UNCW3|nr:TldD/PmbA family protein [candidate division WOR-3 bacterium]
MIGKRTAKKIVADAIRYTKADQIEINIFNNRQALTRFANNYIHQNVSESNSSVSVRVAFGKKIGAASTNSLDFKKIKETIDWAEEIARYQKENADFTSFPAVKKDRYRDVKTFVKRTAAFSSRDRARAVSEIVDTAKKYSLVSYGSVSNGAAEICIGNSSGTFAYAVCGDVFCNIVMSGKNSSGYVQSGSRDVNEMDFRALAEAAAKKAVMSADPIEIEPGRYTTIFEPLAASEFLDFLAYYAFNGKFFEEGRSFLTGKLGQKVVDESITIIDDPFRKTGFAFPFDFEGVPKRRYVLIEKGIAKNVVYDSLTASRAGKKSTGHALSAPNPFGPIPLNLVMKGGADSIAKLIKDTKKGILVTRFHYTNVIEPHKLTFTGMTRDGTFLIENGEITKGIKNLRFTENIVDCLNCIAGLTKRPALVASEPGYGGRFATGVIVPTIKVKDFTFTSSTEF